MSHSTDPASHRCEGWELFTLPGAAVVDPQGEAAHLNGDILDNRIENLTYVITCQQCGVTFGATSTRR